MDSRQGNQGSGARRKQSLHLPSIISSTNDEFKREFPGSRWNERDWGYLNSETRGFKTEDKTPSIRRPYAIDHFRDRAAEYNFKRESLS